jgi:glycerol-3-phosphate acyltransferase PlsY
LSEFFSLLPNLLAAVVVGYLLGALPLAVQISRRLGVDIFSAGTGLTGAANVLRTVGKAPALFVLLGDMGKGALAVIAAGFIGVEGPWLLLPAGAAVAGQWKSVFTGFRGGDGLATLGGGTIALFPVLGTISVAVAIVVMLGGQRMPYTSLMCIVMGYMTLVALSMAYDYDTVLALGNGGLAGLVLAHALIGHRRRRNAATWDEMEDLEEANGAPERSGTGS